MKLIPSTIDLTDDYSVLAGTLFGEIRGGACQAQENVAQAILNRQHHSPTHTIAQICLAHRQFDCWDTTDPNRAQIFAAPHAQPRVWAAICDVAYTALTGKNPDRIHGACNYFACWMKVAPPWARPPSVVTLNDGFHIFIRTQ